jgi:transcription termination/antitermination protein NusA
MPPMIKIGAALLENAELLERERGIPKDVVMDALKEAMLAAYKRFAQLPELQNVECRLLERTGDICIIHHQRVVEDFEDEAEDVDSQVLLKDARKIKADVELGDVLEVDVTPQEFGRIAAQAAKQVIMQRIREAEKYLVMREFEEKRGNVMTAIVQRVEGRNVIVSLGKSEAVLPPREQLPGEYYRVGAKLRVYVADIRDNMGRVPQIVVSQAHPAMVREIFELEVPEIEDGLVEIKHIAREGGFRTKVAVSSNDPSVDPQGACIGNRGSRIQAIVNELRNEKIDIIRWSDDLKEFIINALAPAKIMRVELDEENRRALVVVPDDQLSLAIGREGQNVRLASRLTECRLDIKSISALQQMEASQTEPPEAHDDEAALAPQTPLAAADPMDASANMDEALDESAFEV